MAATSAPPSPPNRLRSAESRAAEQTLQAVLHFLHLMDGTHAIPPKTRSTDRLNVAAPDAARDPMVERLDATFAALADPTRRKMLVLLGKGEASVGELGKPFAMSFAGAAKHVGILERAGLVERRRVGRRQLCRLRAAPLHAAHAWLRQWDA